MAVPFPPQVLALRGQPFLHHVPPADASHPRAVAVHTEPFLFWRPCPMALSTCAACCAARLACRSRPFSPPFCSPRPWCARRCRSRASWPSAPSAARTASSVASRFSSALPPRNGSDRCSPHPRCLASLHHGLTRGPLVVSAEDSPRPSRPHQAPPGYDSERHHGPRRFHFPPFLKKINFLFYFIFQNQGGGRARMECGGPCPCPGGSLKS